MPSTKASSQPTIQLPTCTSTQTRTTLDEAGRLRGQRAEVALSLVTAGRLSTVSIHSEHPFLPPEGERDPLRRFRGRMPQPVTLWCAGDEARRAGWTVSSLLV